MFYIGLCINLGVRLKRYKFKLKIQLLPSTAVMGAMRNGLGGEVGRCGDLTLCSRGGKGHMLGLKSPNPPRLLAAASH